MFRPRPAPLAIHFNGILLAIEPRSERRHTGYSIKVNIIVESFASKLSVFFGALLGRVARGALDLYR